MASHESIKPGTLMISRNDGKTWEPYKPMGKIEEATLIVDDFVPDGAIKFPWTRPDTKEVIHCEMRLADDPALYEKFHDAKETGPPERK